MLPPPDIVSLALAEDIGDGDITTQYFTPAGLIATARIMAKEPCVLAGSELAEEVFRRVDPSLEVRHLLKDGASLAVGDIALEVKGAARSLLTAERVALNFFQRLSGIATMTHRYVEAVRGTGAQILDTRKTTPGWRKLEKAAVAAGGGTNHRMGLYDMVMVKDNHLAANSTAADQQAAILRVKQEHPGMRIELEADTVEQVKEFAAWEGVDVILLDNMTLEELRAAMAYRRPGLVFEASGGITLEPSGEIARTGVDFISVGALTHSARRLIFLWNSLMNLLDPDVLREGSGDGVIGRHVSVFRETASTNDLVLQLGENGEKEGLVLFAEKQTAGRGQFRRPWHSADGLGLWFSILLRRHLPGDSLVLLTPYVSVCAAEALASVTGQAFRIKPPNDIFGRLGKVAGILIEARTGPQPFAVLGIGLNVNHRSEDFPEELRGAASSLLLETAATQDRTAVACAILQRLNARLGELEMAGPPFQALYADLTQSTSASLHRAEI